MYNLLSIYKFIILKINLFRYIIAVQITEEVLNYEMLMSVLRKVINIVL